MGMHLSDSLISIIDNCNFFPSKTSKNECFLVALRTSLSCSLKSQCFCCFQNILRVINLPALIDAECSVVMLVLCHSQPIINVEQHKAESHALIIIMISVTRAVSEMRESQHPGVSQGRLSTLNIV